MPRENRELTSVAICCARTHLRPSHEHSAPFRVSEMAFMAKAFGSPWIAADRHLMLAQPNVPDKPKVRKPASSHGPNSAGP
jgi:hypothetical protein